MGNKGWCTYVHPKMKVCDRCVLGRTDEHHQQLALPPWLFLRSHVALSSSSIAVLLWMNSMFRRSQVMLLEAFGLSHLTELSCTFWYCTNGCLRACLDLIPVIKAFLLGGGWFLGRSISSGALHWLDTISSWRYSRFLSGEINLRCVWSPQGVSKVSKAEEEIGETAGLLIWKRSIPEPL